MATVNVLIAVDVEGALASNDLQNNIYMVDSNKYMGSGFEGTSELMTSLNIGDVIVWTIASIDPFTAVCIQGFGGQAIRNNYIAPIANPLSTQSFESKFQPPGNVTSGTTFQYTVTLSFEKKLMTYDPFLVVI